MRKLTVVVVAAMILLAGCSGGGGGAASPSENGTGTPANETGADISMSQPSSPSGLLNESSGDGSTFDNATEIDLVLFNGTEQISLTSRNDTESGTSLLELSTPNGGTATVYTTSEYSAFRNSTTGEEEYGGPDSGVGGGVGFASAFLIFGASAYTQAVEWETAGTTTVDGEGAFVYEANSLNQSMTEDSQSLDPVYEEGEVDSVDGRLVIGPDGRIYDLNVEIEVPDGTYGTDMSVRYSDVSITKPDWVDESQAP